MHSVSPGSPWYWYQTRTLQRKTIPDEQTCRNHQENISKLNSAAYSKDNTPWSNSVHPYDAKTAKHMQINKHHTPQ
jgi:hypothetical protein